MKNENVSVFIIFIRKINFSVKHSGQSKEYPDRRKTNTKRYPITFRPSTKMDMD